MLATYTVALLVVTLAPLPGPTYPPTGVGVDKLVHLLLFGGLTVLLYGSFVGGRRAPALVASAIGSASVAAVLELLQGLLPYRHEDVWDWVAGAVGAVLAAVLIAWRARVSRTTM